METRNDTPGEEFDSEKQNVNSDRLLLVIRLIWVESITERDIREFYLGDFWLYEKQDPELAARVLHDN